MENLDSLRIASKLLKSQREELKISIEEVALELKLDKKIIEEIEIRDFSNFKNYVFLKGYLKNYANYLGVELNLPEMKKEKKLKENIKSNIKDNDKHTLIKHSKLLIILLLTIITLIFVEQKNYNDNFNADNNIVNKKQSSNKKNNNLYLNKNNNSQQDKENIIIDENNEKIVELDTKINNNNEKNTSAVITKDNLFIEYTKDSWTEIIDSFGNIVFFELVKKGKILEFNILPPFEILLGDATAVNIKYNNKEIQVPFNPDNNVGKLKIKN